MTQEMTSRNDLKWEMGVPNTITKPGNQMCSDEVLHCYNHPVLAVIYNPIHVDIEHPRLFEINVDEIVATDGLKFASKSQTLIEELPLPIVTLDQKIEFGIRAVKLVCEEKAWNIWADKWLSGEDRCTESTIYVRGLTANYAAISAAISASRILYPRFSAFYAANAVVNAHTGNDEYTQKITDIIEEIVKVEK